MKCFNVALIILCSFFSSLGMNYSDIQQPRQLSLREFNQRAWPLDNQTENKFNQSCIAVKNGHHTQDHKKFLVDLSMNSYVPAIDALANLSYDQAALYYQNGDAAKGKEAMDECFDWFLQGVEDHYPPSQYGFARLLLSAPLHENFKNYFKQSDLKELSNQAQDYLWKASCQRPFSDNAVFYIPEAYRDYLSLRQQRAQVSTEQTPSYIAALSSQPHEQSDLLSSSTQSSISQGQSEKDESDTEFSVSGSTFSSNESIALQGQSEQSHQQSDSLSSSTQSSISESQSEIDTENMRSLLSRALESKASEDLAQVINGYAQGINGFEQSDSLALDYTDMLYQVVDGNDHGCIHKFEVYDSLRLLADEKDVWRAQSVLADHEFPIVKNNNENDQERERVYKYYKNVAQNKPDAYLRLLYLAPKKERVLYLDKVDKLLASGEIVDQENILSQMNDKLEQLALKGNITAASYCTEHKPECNKIQKKLHGTIYIIQRVPNNIVCDLVKDQEYREIIKESLRDGDYDVLDQIAMHLVEKYKKAKSKSKLLEKEASRILALLVDKEYIPAYSAYLEYEKADDKCLACAHKILVQAEKRDSRIDKDMVNKAIESLDRLSECDIEIIVQRAYWYGKGIPGYLDACPAKATKLYQEAVLRGHYLSSEKKQPSSSIERICFDSLCFARDSNHIHKEEIGYAVESYLYNRAKNERDMKSLYALLGTGGLYLWPGKTQQERAGQLLSLIPDQCSKKQWEILIKSCMDGISGGVIPLLQWVRINANEFELLFSVVKMIDRNATALEAHKEYPGLLGVRDYLERIVRIGNHEKRQVVLSYCIEHNHEDIALDLCVYIMQLEENSEQKPLEYLKAFALKHYKALSGSTGLQHYLTYLLLTKLYENDGESSPDCTRQLLEGAVGLKYPNACRELAKKYWSGASGYTQAKQDAVQLFCQGLGYALEENNKQESFNVLCSLMECMHNIECDPVNEDAVKAYYLAVPLLIDSPLYAQRCFIIAEGALSQYADNSDLYAFAIQSGAVNALLNYKNKESAWAQYCLACYHNNRINISSSDEIRNSHRKNLLGYLEALKETALEEKIPSFNPGKVAFDLAVDLQKMKKKDESHFYLKRAVIEEYPQALFNWGLRLLKGKKVESLVNTPRQGIMYLIQASKSGIVQAEKELEKVCDQGIDYQLGFDGILFPSDIALVHSFLKKDAPLKKELSASASLQEKALHAYCNHEYEKAQGFFVNLVESGDPYAGAFIGLIYLNLAFKHKDKDSQEYRDYLQDALQQCIAVYVMSNENLSDWGKKCKKHAEKVLLALQEIGYIPTYYLLANCALYAFNENQSESAWRAACTHLEAGERLALKSSNGDDQNALFIYTTAQEISHALECNATIEKLLMVSRIYLKRMKYISSELHPDLKKPFDLLLSSIGSNWERDGNYVLKVCNDHALLLEVLALLKEKQDDPFYARVYGILHIAGARNLVRGATIREGIDTLKRLKDDSIAQKFLGILYLNAQELLIKDLEDISEGKKIIENLGQNDPKMFVFLSRWSQNQAKRANKNAQRKKQLASAQMYLDKLPAECKGSRLLELVYLYRSFPHDFNKSNGELYGIIEESIAHNSVPLSLSLLEKVDIALTDLDHIDMPALAADLSRMLESITGFENTFIQEFNTKKIDEKIQALCLGITKKIGQDGLNQSQKRLQIECDRDKLYNFLGLYYLKCVDFVAAGKRPQYYERAKEMFELAVYSPAAHLCLVEYYLGSMGSITVTPDYVLDHVSNAMKLVHLHARPDALKIQLLNTCIRLKKHFHSQKKLSVYNAKLEKLIEEFNAGRHT